VVRSRIATLTVVLALGGVPPADAQALFTGLLTGHIGAAQGGDVRDATRTVGGSLAVIDRSGYGAEIDIGHTGGFDEQSFADSSVTSFALNFIAVYPEGKFRPFVNVGVGVFRLRAAVSTGQPVEGHTETGWDAGGGLYYAVSEFLAVRGDLRYFRLFGRPEDLVLRDSGFFDYWRTSIGATFTWPIR
jgi:opacity protein-like surface antigen